MASWDAAAGFLDSSGSRHYVRKVCSEGDVICARCGSENEAGVRICGSCGSSVERRCSTCGANVPLDFAYCGVCGARADERPATPAQRSDRRTVTALFADLSGFSRLAEQLDPEDLTVLLNDCFGALMVEVKAYDGWLEKQIGDALVAVFGAPVAHENHAERAVRTALAMQERMRAFNAAHGGSVRPLELHIGINTGLVVLAPGIETEHGADEFVVLGDTVNVAARLQQTATAGQVIVGETTYALTRGAFDYRKLPPLELKGKQERVTAYECLGARSEAGRALRGAASLSSPIVGREAELAALAAALERVKRGGGGIVGVLGEPGVGKSRLLTEARRMSPREVRWLEGRSPPFGQSIAYFALVEIVKSDIGVRDDDGEDERWKKLERRISALFPDQLPEVLPYLAVLLGLEVRTEFAERVRYLDGEAMRHQLFRASRLYFDRLARERPTVLALDDFQWADHASEALVEHLLPLVHAVPLLVCWLARPETRGAGARLRELARGEHDRRYEEVVLGHLSQAESDRLVQNLLSSELSPRLRRVFSRTGGNPFYVEELVRSLIESGAVVPDEAGARWRLVADVDELRVPHAVEGVVMARVDRLEEETKDVLRTAAVIGPSFSYALLQSVTQPDDLLERHLADLEQHGLVRKKQPDGDLAYAFSHGLVQEAVYESILIRRRRELHGRVGRSIERLFRERLDEFYPVLAYHFAAAEDWESASDYLLKAGDRAGEIAADAEAVMHYEQAIAAYSRAFGDDWDPLERATLERKLGEALFHRGENEQARAHMHSALSYLASPYPRSRLRLRIAIGRELLRQVAYRLLPWLFLRRRIDADAELREQLRIYEDLAWIDYFADPESMLLDGLVGTNRAERAGAARDIVVGWSGLGFGWDHAPAFAIAERYHRKALRLAMEAGHPEALAYAYLSLGFHEHRVGRIESALDNYGRSMAGNRQAGHLRRWAAALRGIAMLDRLQGRIAESLEHAREVARVGEDAGDPQAWAWGLQETGGCLWRLGEPDAAAEHLSRAIKLFEDVPDYASAVDARGALAQAHVRADNLDAALALLRTTGELIADHNVRGFACTEPRNAAAEASLLAAERAGGRDRVALMQDAKRACKRARKQGRLDRSALPAAFRLEGRYHFVRGERKRAEKWWRRSLDVGEELGARYELALTSLEIGQRTADPERTSRAYELLRELGVPVPVAAAPRHAEPEAVLRYGTERTAR